MEEKEIYTDEFFQNLIDNPHLLGWLMGKDKLNPLHSEWIKYCWDADEPRGLMAFRGGYKSTAIDVVGIVRWFLLKPDERIAIVRKSFLDSCTIVSAVRQAMELPEIKELFKFAHGFYPKLVMSRDGKLRYNFKTTITPEVSLTAHGIDSSLTGMHYDKIICDDIITLRDRLSRAERERTKEAVRELATNIIDPNKGSMWIGTPWHSDDAWQDINSFCDIAMYPFSKYNFLGDEMYEKKKRTTTPFLFACNYELEIRRDERSLFSDPNMIDTWDYSKKAVAHIDCAYDGDHFNALTIISPLDNPDFTKAKKFQVVGKSYAGNVKEWFDDIVRYYNLYKCTKIYLETNPDKGYTATKLQSRGLSTQTYFENENKHIKISTNLYDYWGKLHFYKTTDDEYLSQIIDYREGSEPDDAPDSLGSIIRELCKPVDKTMGLYEW